jgi:aldose 1-epimerase
VSIQAKVLNDGSGSAAAQLELSSSTLRATFSAFGAALRSLKVLIEGNWVEMTQGFDAESAWLSNAPYFGVTVGRVANRIRQGGFALEGKNYRLEANDGDNHLHGGSQGLSQKVWEFRLLADGVEFSLVSPDGEGGYPGRLEVLCRVTLSTTNVLTTVYEARSDRSTPVNLTNHAYFNLGGPSHLQILDHVLTIDAKEILENNSSHVPSGKFLAVAGTAFDFLVAKPIGQDLVKLPGGYDHCYVLNSNNAPLPEVREVARVELPGTGRVLKFSTDQSGFQFYTGNYLDGIVGRAGITLQKQAAFCLESQRFPDSVNHPEWEPIILRPGEVYRHEFRYAFGFPV